MDWDKLRQELINKYGEKYIIFCKVKDTESSIYYNESIVGKECYAFYDGTENLLCWDLEGCIIVGVEDLEIIGMFHVKH